MHVHYLPKADLYSSTMTQYMALALAVAFIIILGLENLIICFSACITLLSWYHYWNG